MKVKDLIAKLSNFDPDTEVVNPNIMDDDDPDCSTISSVIPIAVEICVDDFGKIFEYQTEMTQKSVIMVMLDTE